jgi:hypothetical protein
MDSAWRDGLDRKATRALARVLRAGLIHAPLEKREVRLPDHKTLISGRPGGCVFFSTLCDRNDRQLFQP